MSASKIFIALTALGLLAGFGGSAQAIDHVVHVPWFIVTNGTGGGYDTWIEIRNLRNDDLVFFFDYYDAHSGLVLATDSVWLVGKASTGYYPGQWPPTLPTRGFLAIRWTSDSLNPRDDISGYISVINWSAGFCFSVSFDY